MIVAKSDELIKYAHKKTAVALGSFDAIHKGHTAIICEAVSYAQKNGMLSAVQLFEVPPAVLGGAKAINTFQKRLDIIEALGADMVVVERFDEQFKNVGHTDFVREYLKKRYNSGAVFAGGNYRFGHFAKGDVKSLEALCTEQGIKTKIIDCLELDGVISSTRIRDCISSGEVEMAARLMTRPYCVSGEVVHGNALGQKLGFPTANMDIPTGRLIPKFGVYASRVRFDGKSYRGVTNIGAKPTVECQSQNIETHILDFGGDLYGKTVEIEFLKRIRDIKKFEDLKKLKNQLKEDIEKVEQA